MGACRAAARRRTAPGVSARRNLRRTWVDRPRAPCGCVRTRPGYGLRSGAGAAAAMGFEKRWLRGELGIGSGWSAGCWLSLPTPNELIATVSVDLTDSGTDL